VPRGRAQLVLSEIKVAGAAGVAKRIDADESFGLSVMDGIATGDSVWLVVADQLTPASAASAASFAIALASALPRSPEKVLAMVGPKYPVQQVCGIPFLKSDSAMVSTYHESAAAALSRVQAAPLSTRPETADSSGSTRPTSSRTNPQEQRAAAEETKAQPWLQACAKLVGVRHYRSLGGSGPARTGTSV
jgi:hypothetical protein